MNIMNIFKRSLPTPIREYDQIESPLGPVSVHEWDNYIAVCINENPSAFVSVRGDMMEISFNFCCIFKTEDYLERSIWILNSPEIAEILNDKFGNCKTMKYSAATFCNTVMKGEHQRSCVILPTDTVETAQQRLNSVWYKQPAVGGCCVGEFFQEVKEA